MVLTWAEVKIGHTAWLLPAAEDYIFAFGAGSMKGETWRIQVRFTNYRHFQAESRLQFDDSQE